VTRAAEDEFQRHFERAETLIAEGNKTGASAENANALAVLPKDSRALAQLKQIAAMPETVRAETPPAHDRPPVQAMPPKKSTAAPSPQPSSSSSGATGSGMAAPADAGSTPRPPTVTAPAPPAPAPPLLSPQSAVTPDEAAIRTTLREYAAGFESLSVDAVRRVYPGVDAAALERSFRHMSSQQIEIRVDRISIDGAIAVVHCEVRQAFTPRVGQGQSRTLQSVFRFQKSGGRWVIIERR
jgi:hypothetical protein